MFLLPAIVAALNIAEDEVPRGLSFAALQYAFKSAARASLDLSKHVRSSIGDLSRQITGAIKGPDESPADASVAISGLGGKLAASRLRRLSVGSVGSANSAVQAAVGPRPSEKSNQSMGLIGDLPQGFNLQELMMQQGENGVWSPRTSTNLRASGVARSNWGPGSNKVAPTVDPLE